VQRTTWFTWPLGSATVKLVSVGGAPVEVPGLYRSMHRAPVEVPGLYRSMHRGLELDHKSGIIAHILNCITELNLPA
jgi:hypothetical protein